MTHALPVARVAWCSLHLLALHGALPHTRVATWSATASPTTIPTTSATIAPAPWSHPAVVGNDDRPNDARGRNHLTEDDDCPRCAPTSPVARAGPWQSRGPARPLPRRATSAPHDLIEHRVGLVWHRAAGKLGIRDRLTKFLGCCERAPVYVAELDGRIQVAMQAGAQGSRAAREGNRGRAPSRQELFVVAVGHFEWVDQDHALGALAAGSSRTAS